MTGPASTDLEPVADGVSPLRRPVRFLCFFLFWIALGRVGPADLAMGAIAAAVAGEISLRLLPPPRGPLVLTLERIRAVLAFCGHFLRRSALAGVDVTRRVFAPSMALAPGIVAVDCGLPEGLMRRVFAASISLQPGTLPFGADEETLLLHVLDLDGPVLDELGEDAAVFLEAAGVLDDDPADDDTAGDDTREVAGDG